MHTYILYCYLPNGAFQEQLFKYLSVNDGVNGVNDLNISANESIFFSFVCRMTHKNAQKCF